VQPAQDPGEARHLALYRTLTGHLAAAGVTIEHADLPDEIAHWTAATKTLTLHNSEGLAEHVEILGDFINMISLDQPSRLGARPLPPRRHLHVVD